MQRLLMAAIAIHVLASGLRAESDLPPWTQISLSTCGVDKFQRENPEVDGRGVVIAVLDTGVDMGVAGLTHTPAGEVKVIDVRDFTGQGDVELEEIKYDAKLGRFVHHAADGAPEEYSLAEAGSHGEGTMYWFGAVREKNFANSAVPDINDNGKEDDEFGLLVVAAAGALDDDAVVYIDLNMNRDWSDERALRNYHVKFDSFRFTRSKKEKQIAPLSCGLNVYLREKKVVIHFDDGGHGTHVSGIAAGYRINGQRNFHGVAPGAKIISLKLGNNNLAGGATVTESKKKAFEYAAKYSRQHNVPVVCNLSYGIGSEQEGHSDIDKFLDDLCKANPNLIVFSSAGNLGPGLSTVGTPAAASAVITVAALLGTDTARDVLGFQMDEPQVAVFSSRGGELSKPTIATPGYATSTIPHWSRRRDFMRGTSMASPYAAGMGALMVSAARRRYPDMQQRSSWIKAALQNSATPMEHFQPHDFGAGIPDITPAVESYVLMGSTLQDEVLFDYEIETISPLAVGGKSPAAYWRTAYYPNDRSQVFTITPRFVPTSDAEAIASFSKQYTIRSNAEWCVPREQQVYFRSEQSATVRVDYDSSKLTEPGLYVAIVSGEAAGQIGFRLVNTVIVPHTFGPRNRYHLILDHQKVDGWRIQRHFFSVPPGASAMHLKLRASTGMESELRARELFKPDGSDIGNRDFVLDTRNQKTEASWTVTEDLEPGVWELCTYSVKPGESAHYDLDVRFSGVRADPPTITTWKHKVGKLPGGSVTLTELFDSPIPYQAHGKIEGYQVRSDEKLTPKDDVAESKIRFNPEIKAIRIECEFSSSDFAKFTDVAVNVFDKNGTAIAKGGMGYRQLSMLVKNPDPSAESVECSLEIQPAFTQLDESDEATAHLTITSLYKNQIEVTAGAGTLYPGVGEKVKFKLSASPPEAPQGASTVGFLAIKNGGSGEEIITIPIEKQ